jgi:hypothetical protein
MGKRLVEDDKDEDFPTPTPTYYISTNIFLKYGFGQYLKKNDCFNK